MRKLMLSIRQDKYESLMREANARNVTVQEFVRVVVIPEWIKKNVRPAAGKDSCRVA